MRIPVRVGPNPVDSTAETVYTCPAGKRAILRFVIVNNPGTATTFTLSVGVDAAGTRLLEAVSIAQNVPFERHLYVPLAATEVIQLDSAADDQLICTLGVDEIAI